jgi:hypothetical protein
MITQYRLTLDDDHHTCQAVDPIPSGPCHEPACVIRVELANDRTCRNAGDIGENPVWVHTYFCRKHFQIVAPQMFKLLVEQKKPDPDAFFHEGADATTGELRDCVRGVRMIGRNVHVKDDLRKCRYEIMTGFDLPYEMLDAVFPGQTGPWTLERVQDLLVGDVERRIQLVKEERERTGCGMAEALQRVKEREGM